MHFIQEMSYNNYLDADAAWNCVSEFTNPTCVVVKHTNPRGVASQNNLLEAYRLAVKADPVSAFGGIVAFNVEVDEVNLESYLILKICSCTALEYVKICCSLVTIQENLLGYIPTPLLDD